MSPTKLHVVVCSLLIAAFVHSQGAEAGVKRGGVLPPFAYIQFCVHHASACHDTKGDLPTVNGAKVVLNSKLQRQLATVNTGVNASIRPRARGMGDPWTMGGKYGDCNSYALTKREKLIAAGWPSRALSLTVVKTSWGEGHLILSVHTTSGTVVLDNLSPSMKPISQVPYKLISMQEGSSLQWSSRSVSFDKIGATGDKNKFRFDSNSSGDETAATAVKIENEFQKKIQRPAARVTAIQPAVQSSPLANEPSLEQLTILDSPTEISSSMPSEKAITLSMLSGKEPMVAAIETVKSNTFWDRREEL